MGTESFQKICKAQEIRAELNDFLHCLHSSPTSGVFARAMGSRCVWESTAVCVRILCKSWTSLSSVTVKVHELKYCSIPGRFKCTESSRSDGDVPVSVPVSHCHPLQGLYLAWSQWSMAVLAYALDLCQKQPSEGSERDGHLVQMTQCCLITARTLCLGFFCSNLFFIYPSLLLVWFL